MKLLSYSLAVLAFLWVAQTSRADEKRFDDAQRFLFHSILEGLYEDGVSTEDVDRILLKREKEDYFHFIHACPVCMGPMRRPSRSRSPPAVSKEPELRRSG